MQSFRLFFEAFENSDTSPTLSPRMIYDFNFLVAYLLDHGHPKDDYAKHIFDIYLNKNKDVYLREFSKLIRQQLEKYYGRKRVDPDFKLSSTMDAYKLNELMHKTFRSDMKTRNDRWNILSDLVAQLPNTNGINGLIRVIDGINNCTHNTQESILSKFSNYRELLNAFNCRARLMTLAAYAPYISNDLKPLLKNY